MNGLTLWGTTGKTGDQYGCSSAVFATRDQQRRAVFSFDPTRPGPWPDTPPWIPLWAPRLR
ncbi:hypothetical protein [Streptomyces decoyicus]|uniref:hypothetical protein n=1 Tax=Streptomyces decoyicus TaxID=249567 RepID=UPI002E31C7EB|nr:hypothetical protein [Streptomyces decoyicus]